MHTFHTRFSQHRRHWDYYLRCSRIEELKKPPARKQADIPQRGQVYAQRICVTLPALLCQPEEALCVPLLPLIPVSSSCPKRVLAIALCLVQSFTAGQNGHKTSVWNQDVKIRIKITSKADCLKLGCPKHGKCTTGTSLTLTEIWTGWSNRCFQQPALPCRKATQTGLIRQ